MKGMRPDWLSYLLAAVLLTLLIQFPLILLFCPGWTPDNIAGYCLNRLTAGPQLGLRWLLAGTLSVLCTILLHDRRHRLHGGISRVPSGPYGDARFANARERAQLYPRVRYTQAQQPGITLEFDRHSCEVDTSDRTVLLVCPPGGGKTKSVLLPTLYYNAIVNRNTGGRGASILSVDCKGEEYQATHQYMREHGYRTLLLDFRNPLSSLQYNMLAAVNEYMEIAKTSGEPTAVLEARANAERHAKLLADAICAATEVGAYNRDNPFFTETARGLITAMILVVSEFGQPAERHIVSVFRLIVELNGLLQQGGSRDDRNQKSRLGTLLELLPGNVRAKLYAGAATSADVRTSMNVFASALAKLLSFLDAKLEQMVCGQSEGLTAGEFLSEPTCIYLVLPDEDNTAHFFATLFIQQMSTSLIAIASRRPGQRLSREVLVLWDEFGQAPPCQGLESWVTAWRSRGIRLLLAVQTEAQLEARYGRSRAEIIRKAVHTRMYAYLGAGDTAQALSKEMGSYTVVTSSVTNSGRSGSSSQSMTGRPLMTNDEIGSLPIGTWLVLAGGHHPILARLKTADRVWEVESAPCEGARRPVREVPYLTEEKLRERYGVPEKISTKIPVPETAPFRNKKTQDFQKGGVISHDQ